MTPVQIARAVRRRTKNDTNSLTNSDLTLEYNIVKEKLASRITKSVSKDYFNVPFYRDLVTGVREYSWPSDFQGAIKKVGAKLDINDLNRYIPLRKLDMTQFDFDLNEESIVSNFTNSPGDAGYDLQRSSLILYCNNIPAIDQIDENNLGVLNGLKLWASAWPEDIKDADWSSDVDRSIPTDGINVRLPRTFHPIIVDMLAIVFKQDGDKPLALTEREQNIEYYIKQELRAIQRTNKDPDFRLPSFEQTDFGASFNNGYNL